MSSHATYSIADPPAVPQAKQQEARANAAQNENSWLAYYLGQERNMTARLQAALYKRDQLVCATPLQLAHTCRAVHLDCMCASVLIDTAFT